jgi:hypothetical protein
MKCNRDREQIHKEERMSEVRVQTSEKPVEPSGTYKLAISGWEKLLCTTTVEMTRELGCVCVDTGSALKNTGSL